MRNSEARTQLRKLRLHVLIALFCLLATAGAFAQTVDMKMVSAGSTIVDGYYIGPYYALIGESIIPAAVICDDFASETYLNETWQATVSSLADLSGTRFYGLSNSQALYEQAVWLSAALMNASTAQEAADIQYATWGLFSGSAPVTTGSQSWKAMAEIYAPTANIAAEIYTPVAGTAFLNGSRMDTPQEFIRIRTPEAATMAILGADLVGLALLLIFVRRRSAMSHAS